MKLATVPMSHLSARLAQHGAEYGEELSPAIVERGCDSFVVDTDHPAFVALKVKHAPTPEELAQRDEAAKAAMEQAGRELWDAIHRCKNPTPEFIERITNLIPCGTCREHWVEMLKRTPPDLSSLENYFKWTVERHDEVNARLGRPAFGLPAARELYGR